MFDIACVYEVVLDNNFEYELDDGRYKCLAYEDINISDEMPEGGGLDIQVATLERLYILNGPSQSGQGNQGPALDV